MSNSQKTKKQSCATCKFLDRGDAKRLSEFRAYWCTAPIPDMPPVPSSAMGNIKWPDNKTQKYTCPNYGENCPAYEKVKK